ncbi:MAG: diguanylate cyclase [Acidimicrobiales bacterium]|nr:diguanylate cyclase [Acidimicrobiales bacterium]
MRHEGTRLTGSSGVAADREGNDADRLADVLAALRSVAVGTADASDLFRAHLEAGCRAVAAPAGCVVVGGDGTPVTVVSVVDPAGVGEWSVGDEITDPVVRRALDERMTIAPLPSPGVRASVISPVWASGRVAGAVVLLGGVEREIFSALDLALVDLLADGLGRVFEQSEASAGRPAVVSAWDAVGDGVALLDSEGREILAGGSTRPFDPARDLRSVGSETPDAVVRTVRDAVRTVLQNVSPVTRVLNVGTGTAARSVEARFAPLHDDQVVCVTREVTDRQRMDRVMGEQVALAKLLRSISTRLLLTDADDLDAGITRALRELVEFTGAASAVVYELDLSGSRLHRTHRWSEANVDAEDPTIGEAGTSWLRGRLGVVDHLILSPSTVGTPAGVAPPPGQGQVLWLRLGVSPSEADPGGNADQAPPTEGFLLIRWRPGRAGPEPSTASYLANAAALFQGALRRRRAAALSLAYAQVFEGIARDEPLDRALHAVGRLVAQHTLGSEVVVLHVDGDRLSLVAGEERWRAWFADRPVNLTSPYGQAVVTGQPVLVVDTAHDHRFGLGCVPDDSFTALQILPVASSSRARPGALIVVLGTTSSGVMVQGPVKNAATSLIAVALERDEDHRRLAHQATHDPLTGVGNRAALVQRLEAALISGRESGRRVAVLYADLDGFKDVNDRYGHDHGDRLLIEVARRISNAVRTGDLVARSGGDEFVVVCENLDSADQAAVIAEKVHAAVEDRPVELGDVALQVVMSVGVALADPVLDDADRLLRVADLAMYEAKGRGARAEGEAPATRGARSRFTVDLVRAISSGDLEIHQQPILSMDDVLVGVEVLLRWPGPERRAVGPERVARAAAEAGYAAALGRWVRRQALAQRSAWPLPRSASDVPPVHVNVAATDLLSVGFVVGVLDDLRDAGADGSDLVLELQAGDLRRTDVRAVVHELARHGVAMMVDGLGGGGLPLTELVQLPLQGARLGPQISSRLNADAAVASVAEALVTMCRGVGWVSHAVGIEEPDQRSAAGRIGFDAVQGWLTGEPLGPEAFTTWLKDRFPPGP